MTALVPYETGTISVEADGTAVVGDGPNWSSTNVRPGDRLDSGHFTALIVEVVDQTHLTITPWPGSTLSGAQYKIWPNYPQRVVGAEAMSTVNRLVADLSNRDIPVIVGANETEPDPSLGDDDQYADQPTTGKKWVKVGGVWTFIGIFKALRPRGDYDNDATYSVGDWVNSAGSSYVWNNETPGSGHAPPNATYWDVLAARGTDGDDGAAATVEVGTVTTGAGGSAAHVTNSGTSNAAVLDFTIPAGKSYGGTSTTSLAIGTGSKVFTTQAGLAYTDGGRVRATATAGATGWLEGVATYSGTTLTIASDKDSGSGTGTAWNFNVVGEPGAGDMSSANYASEYIGHEAEVRRNLGIQSWNRIINGGMMVSQQNGSVAGTVSDYYAADQWPCSAVTSGAFSFGQVASASPGGSPNRLRFTVTTADASVAASDIVVIQQRIEGYRLADLKFGTAAPKSITIQFGVKAPAGTYCVALLNGAANRCFVGEYTIAGGEANTDVVKSVTLVGDSAGTWAKDNTLGMYLSFTLMVGTTYQQAAGTWHAASGYGTSNQFNLMGTLGNVFELFDVGLYEGSVAPPFQLPDFEKELDACQRYWEKSYDYAVAPGTAGNFNGVRASLQNSAPASYGAGHFLKRKRIAPTVTLYSPNSGASGNGYDTVDRAATAARVGETGYHISNVFGSSTTPMLYHFTANARL
ncbi:hypothetical protein [Bradyrhizobium sp. 191]|uniref:hypothetical protein n=1 Tax=Bradyrhizobium sp. 191 TaxID=2782659 RepID=UPI001FFF871E|nr:hypothetical protein [Bradyrhizobium sp. 191]UPJ65222.1 hypothetical protein IVB23_35755 [Bradyrhizobium sp. 191]